MTIATEPEAPFPTQQQRSDYARGYRSGLKEGMVIGHVGGRAHEQMKTQQHIEDIIRAMRQAGLDDQTEVLRNFAAQLPDPRRNRETGS